MRLKEIDIRGFKSFPDKTVVNFKEGITAIVGPNGSGKSNISDAIKWVLGEQSVKSLRGNSMKDVIFAGTNNRKALGYAEVTITFDNESGKIPIDYKEVAFTRRVFRSGESEYYINKNSCRLMDIRELLMDTGIGKEGYSIIGQGKIDEILSNKSEDRRTIFEEAAGIVKYKSKKENSEKKLKRTEENLIRVNDLVLELEKQEKSLKDQAVKAKKYKELFKELKELDINLYLDRVNKLINKISKLNKEIDDLITKKNLSNSEYDDLKVLKDKLNFELKNIQQKLEEANNEKFKLIQKIENEKNNINLINEKISYNKKDLDRINKEDLKLEKSILNIEEKEKELIVDLKKKSEEFKLMQERQKEDICILDEKNLFINKLEEEVEKNKNKLIELYNESSDTKSKLNSIISFNENIDNRMIQLKNLIEDEELKKKSTLESKELIIKSKKQLIEDIKNFKVQFEKINKDMEDEELKFKKLEDELNDLNIHIETNISNQRLYKSMENSYDGYYYGVKSVLKASKENKILANGLVGVVADLIRTEEDYEVAISTALGGSAQNIVTLSQNDGKNIIEYLRKNKKGRVTCLPLDVIKGRKIEIKKEDRINYNIIGIASELVEFKEEYKNIIENLLGRTIIIKDMRSAIKLSNKYNNSLRIITLAGDIINPGGSMTGGSQGSNNINILSRKNKIDRLEKNINISIRKKENILVKRENILNKTKEARLKNVEIENILKEKEYELIKIENKLENEINEIERINKTIDISKLEIETMKEELLNSLKERKLLEELVLNLNEELFNIREFIKDNEDSIVNKKEIRDSFFDKVTNNKIVLNKQENNIKNMKENLDRYNSNKLYNKDIVNKNKQEKTLIEEDLKYLLKSIEKSKENIIEIKVKVDEMENKILELSRNKERIDKKYNSILLKEDVKLKDISNKTEKIKQLEVLQVKSTLKKESLDENLYKNYSIDYNTAFKYKIEGLQLENLEEQTNKLKKDIKKLGNINLNSIEEYDELKERLDFILNQKEDLNKAKKDLLKVINDVEKKMEEIFINSFNEINTNFKIIFKTLFNGGKANLILEDKENILETGIDIQAQPPGKKLQSLSSLSGGERSLVAVSLLFAILKIRPSPFCILDEIDAALDEANIGRYTSYLQNISKDTQFIIITHRKTTMEMADTLYGVTMEEEGVSKILSVELTEYEDVVS